MAQLRGGTVEGVAQLQPSKHDIVVMVMGWIVCIDGQIGPATESSNTYSLFVQFTVTNVEDNKTSQCHLKSKDKANPATMQFTI